MPDSRGRQEHSAPGRRQSRLIAWDAIALAALVALALLPAGSRGDETASGDKGQWTRANGRMLHEASQRPSGAASGKLKWRKARFAEPKRLAEPADSKPLPAAADSNSQPGATSVVRALAEQADEAGSGHIVLTKAVSPEPDPFVDPFAQDDADGKAAGLKLDGHHAGPRSLAVQEPPPDEEDLLLPEPDDTTEPIPPEELVQAPPLMERCPQPEELKAINQITDQTDAEPGEFPPECPLGDAVFTPRAWPLTVYTWKASALCHKPLYFEQVAAERYGHSWGPLVQPIVSGAHFFATVPILPYKMGLEPPWECIYPLGYYRPGSCAPYTVGPLPVSLRGAALQGAVVTGAVFAFP